MSATNKTLNYELPQFIATDKPAWLVDFNTAMSDIDTAIKEAKTAGDNAQQTANTNAANIQTLDGTVTSQGTALGVLSGDVAGNTGSINTINSLIGNGHPTTTDKTIIGAINEINAKVGDVEADNVSFNNANTGLVATDVQTAIVEVKGLIPSGPGSVDADDVDFDNTTSGLTATNVQDAIDELAQGGGSTTPDFNLVNHDVATVNGASGVTLDKAAVNVLTNADASIGKIYGGFRATVSTVTANTDTTVATITSTALPTISAAYNILIGVSNIINLSSGAVQGLASLTLHFNTNGSVDVVINTNTAVSTASTVLVSLAPCLYFLKDLGD